ncbi:19035_t:CDS:10 [Funneliformis geosporum]|uniref:3338_t:CDS:1 n=1 Tax=Funneliformis geosporum TaxID=1117311 RepID=A0A9W4SJ11_9GLOM|nr:19035_t:CDS:10 [Funneliformis geosporum]CAI2170837.1 3338_t:CDS:10 [Funneliformis geosporum]
MGVSGLLSWLSMKYPKIIEEIPVEVNKEFDNLYIDMNHIIHSSCPENESAPDIIIKKIFEYIEQIVAIIRPRRVLYLAIDGVPPRAKMNQQRSRRFIKAKENATKSFDSNCITPGTLFMARLAEGLRYLITDKFNTKSTESGWKKLKVILSDASVPGEGEHKIMDFIRAHRASPDHDPNTSHVIFSMDADLILLSLATHEPHFKILLEKKRTEDQATQNQEYAFINIQVLREYLEIKFKANHPFSFNLEKAIDDWVFICLFVGNDFLPNLPFLKIWENAIDILISIWNKLSESVYLTDCGVVDLTKLQNLVKELGRQQLCDDGYKKNYYKQKFGVELPNKEFQTTLVKSYIKGLYWVSKYYYQGVPSWKWYYPHHYSPFASDFIDVDVINEVDLDELGEPLKPFEHLMIVLPPHSKEHLPEPLQNLMTEKDSEIIEFYDNTDLNGETIVSKYPQLNDDDITLNAHGSEILFISNHHHKFYSNLYSLYSKNGSVEMRLDSSISDKLIGFVSKDSKFINEGDNIVNRSLSVRYKLPAKKAHKCTLLPNVKMDSPVLGSGTEWRK